MAQTATVSVFPYSTVQQDQKCFAQVAVSYPAVAQIETVTVVADVAGSLNSRWFHLYSALDAVHYYVWYNVNSAGVDPAVSGATGIPVALATGASASTVATATAAAIDALAAFISTALSAVVTITNAATGLSTTPSNGTASPGFAYAITTPGSGIGTISLGSAQPQIFLTASPPQNPPISVGFIDVARGNAIQSSGNSVFSFDFICHAIGAYTISAILYDTSGNSIPVTPASLTVAAVH